MKKLVILIVILIAGYIGWQVNNPSADNKLSKITISGPFEFHGIDTSTDGSVFTRLGVTQTLTRLAANGDIEPLLAQNWQESEDGLSWTFHIRDNVQFHNGKMLTAQDVAASLNRAITKPGVIKTAPIQQIRANGNELVIELLSPYRPLLNSLAHFTAAIVSADSFDSEGKMIQLNATGPFTIKEMVAPHKLTVAKFANYWATPAEIDVIEYQAGHRSESRALQVQSGQADIAYSIDAVSKNSLNGSEKVSVHSINLPRTILLKLNNQHPLLSEVKARQALSFALDRTGIANSILFSPGSEAYQLFSENQSAWHVEQPDPARNLEAAQRLLAELGWSKGESGFLEKAGQRFTLHLTTYADRPELPLIATAIQNQLADVGVEVTVSIDNSSSIPAGHNDDTLELALIARNFGMTGTPLPLLYDDFSQVKGSDWGHMNWTSSAVKADLDNLIAENDPQRQREYSQRIAQVLADELPVIPVAYSSQHIAVNKTINGFNIDPFELDYRLEALHFND